MHYFNSFPIMFYYIISTTYQKIGDLFCPVHISELSHSVRVGTLEVLQKFNPKSKCCPQIGQIQIQIDFLKNHQ
jgi:hypothetical protein